MNAVATSDARTHAAQNAGPDSIKDVALLPLLRLFLI